MAEKFNNKETASHEEIIMSLVYTQGALVMLLEKKGIIKRGELLEEIKQLKDITTHRV